MREGLKSKPEILFNLEATTSVLRVNPHIDWARRAHLKVYLSDLELFCGPLASKNWIQGFTHAMHVWINGLLYQPLHLVYSGFIHGVAFTHSWFFSRDYSWWAWETRTLTHCAISLVLTFFKILFYFIYKTSNGTILNTQISNSIYLTKISICLHNCLRVTPTMPPFLCLLIILYLNVQVSSQILLVLIYDLFTMLIYIQHAR